MNRNCELIKDLLPLYVENLCSNYTREIVDEHIKDCKDCSSMLKSLQEADKLSENEKLIRRKNNPFRKVRRRNFIKTISCVLCAIVLVSVLYLKLFSIGTSCATSDVTFNKIEMLDEMTFELEITSDKKHKEVNLVKAIVANNSDLQDTVNKEGVIYLKVNTVLNLPFMTNKNYVMGFGFDEGALGSDSIKEIYLIGKEKDDIILIWEQKELQR